MTRQSPLAQLCAQIVPPDADGRLRLRALARLDRLTKPPGSLGRLESLAADYVAMTGQPDLGADEIPRGAIVTFAADHGVALEGVSAYPAAVTPQMVLNFLRGGAAVNVLARHVGLDVRVVDIGVAYEFGTIAGLWQKKIRAGTRNLLVEPALTRKEAERALLVGVEMAQAAIADGVRILGTGEMGIGNTTPSAAITAVMTGRPVSTVTGRGTGIEEVGYARKLAVIEAALERHRPAASDALGVLATVGGFEIAGLAGLILGAAAARVPVMVDGFIAGAAALIAVGLQPACRHYLLASHRSVEPGHRVQLEQLGLTPLLELDLRLGEGTGACLGIDLLLAALKIYTQMATFDEAGVTDRV